MRHALRLYASVVLLLLPVWAQAAGPGLGNLTYSTGELWRPISVLDSPQGGHGNVAMVNGYLMVISASDGAVETNAGGIEFWDVSNPRRPVLVVRHDNNDTHGLREAHGFSLSLDATRTILAAQAHEGIQFWNLSDPLRIALLRYMDLPGINQGDYSGAWWVFWQAPYVYVAGTGSGLYVINATDPSNPTLVTRMSTSQLGGLIPAQVFALGNLLVLMEAASGTYATMDISDPTKPVLLQLFHGKRGYSHLFAAGKIFTAGGNGAVPRMYVHSVTPQGQIAFVGEAGSDLGNGGYGSYQDGMFHAGFSNTYAKFEVATLRQLGTGSSGLEARDEDFGLVLGNLVFVGDDHGVGSALVVHQTAPDTRGPEVHWVHPPNGATNMPLTTRVGVSMSDNIDVASVNANTFMVRPLGGQALPGRYSVQMGLVNFTPAVPLQANTTYEVVISGMQDYVRNRAPAFSSRFSTPTSTPALPPGGVVSQVRTTSGAAYQVGTFRSGALLYIDRAFSFASPFPTAFEGQQYIQTGNNDKASTGAGFLTFQVATAATVHVLYDARATRVPAWLGDGTWLRTGETVGTNDSGTSRVVYKKTFQAGTVTLGGNADAPALGAGSMYSVLVIGTGGGGGTPPSCALLPGAPAQVDATVSFAASTATGSAPLTYTWDFGDGSPPTSPSSTTTTQHAYGAPGRYSVTLTARNAVGSSKCATVQIIHNPLTAVPAVSASPIIHNGTYAITVNPDSHTVTAIHESNLSKAWEVGVGNTPRTLAAAPNGNIWVVNQGDATLSVLNPGTGALLQTIALPAASRPYALAFSPDGSAAYVTLQGTGRLLKLDLSGRIVGDLAIGPKPRGLAISGDARRLLVTRFISPTGQGEVREVELATLRVLRTISLAFDPGPDTEASGLGVPNYLSSIRISPDGLSALVPSKKDNIARGLFRNGQALTFESTVRTIVSQLDLSSNSEDLRGRIDLNDRDMAQWVLFSPVGDVFFVSAQGSNKVQIYDAVTTALLGEMSTGLAPQGMALNRDASKLYVQNFLSRTVSVFQTTDIIKGMNNTAPLLAEVPTGRETLSAQVLRGKQIFYNAADRRMSRDGYLSCASCHLDGESDGQIWDFTQRGTGLRNTIPLVGRAGTGHGNLHWTANFDEVQDFENDIRREFLGTGFLSEADFAATSDPLGPRKIGRSADLDALAAYVSSLTTVPASPYRQGDGTLTAAGQAGKALFAALRCQTCHPAPDFTDRQRHDVGTLQASSGTGLLGLGMETPTLKGIWDSAPYLHHGQAATLYDVVNNARHSGRVLTTTESEQLVAYLLQIDEAEKDLAESPTELQISRLTVSTGQTYRVDVLTRGALVYIDRTYVWSTIPPQYEGAQFIVTANNDKYVTVPNYLSFVINIPATVYVAFDYRVIRLPAWLSDGSWSLLPEIIDTSDTRRRVYRKRFPAGPVVLGGNSMAPSVWSGISNYNVIIIED